MRKKGVDPEEYLKKREGEEAPATPAAPVTPSEEGAFHRVAPHVAEGITISPHITQDPQPLFAGEPVVPPTTVPQEREQMVHEEMAQQSSMVGSEISAPGEPLAPVMESQGDVAESGMAEEASQMAYAEESYTDFTPYQPQAFEVDGTVAFDQP